MTDEPIIKYGHVLPISNEMAMDYGIIPDTRPPVVIPRRTRLRWKIAELSGRWRPHFHFGACDHEDCY